ncbi:MAG: phosphate ABC transporter ATP-binding protein [Thermoprotei archaeon]
MGEDDPPIEINNPILKVENCNVWYKEIHVLENINISIPRNTIFAIMGPSGSGKSTLLRVFNRLIELNPDARIEGRIFLDGKNIYEIPATEVRRRIGMVFQQPNPFPHMSIYDNIAFAVKANKIARKREEIDQIVEDALRKAVLWDEVKDNLKMKAGKLSGGQQQRLVIARALALKPDVLLMDEPVSMIDVVGARKIEELMINLKNDITIVLVTHNSQQAARVSDYVAFLYQGKIIEWGLTSKIFTNPKNELTEKYVLGKIG